MLIPLLDFDVGGVSDCDDLLSLRSIWPCYSIWEL